MVLDTKGKEIEYNTIALDHNEMDGTIENTTTFLKNMIDDLNSIEEDDYVIREDDDPNVFGISYPSDLEDFIKNK